MSFDGQHIKDQVGGESIHADLVGVEFGYGGLGFLDLTREPDRDDDDPLAATEVVIIGMSKEFKMDWQNHIIVDPKILVGKPVIKGTRLAVEFIVDLLAQGWAESEILRNYPGITHDDVTACLKYAKSN